MDKITILLDEIKRWDLFTNLMIPILVALGIYTIINNYKNYKEIKSRDNFLNMYTKYELKNTEGDLFISRVDQYSRAIANLKAHNSIAVINEFGSGKTYFTEKVLLSFIKDRKLINISLIDYLHDTPIEGILVTALLKEKILTKKDANKLYTYMKDDGINLIFKSSPNFSSRMLIINKIIKFIIKSNTELIIVIDDIVRSDRGDINEILSVLKHINDSCAKTSFIYLLSKNQNLDNDWKRLMTPPYLYKYVSYLIYLKYYKISDYFLNDLWNQKIEKTDYIKYLIINTINEFNEKNIEEHNKKIVDYRNIKKLHERISISLNDENENEFIKRYMEELINKKYSQHGRVQFNNHNLNQLFSLDRSPKSAIEMLNLLKNKTPDKIIKHYWDSWKTHMSRLEKNNTKKNYRLPDSINLTYFIYSDNLNEWKNLTYKYDTFNNYFSGHIFMCDNDLQYKTVLLSVDKMKDDLKVKILNLEVKFISTICNDFNFNELTEDLLDFLGTMELDWRVEMMKHKNGKVIIKSLSDFQVIK